MGCGVYWQQIHELESALGSLRRFGLDQTPAFNQLNSLRGELMKRVGFKFPRVISQLLKLAALSPGTITLFHDVETGYFVKARATPGAPPIFHPVTHEEAAVIIKGEISPELHERLFTPDTYIGE